MDLCKQYNAQHSLTIVISSFTCIFYSQETFTSMIEDAGFANVTHENLLFGVVAIHSGFKI